MPFCNGYSSAPVPANFCPLERARVATRTIGPGTAGAAASQTSFEPRPTPTRPPPPPPPRHCRPANGAARAGCARPPTVHRVRSS
jgi:hypothetical protein